MDVLAFFSLFRGLIHFHRVPVTKYQFYLVCNSIEKIT